MVDDDVADAEAVRRRGRRAGQQHEERGSQRGGQRARLGLTAGGAKLDLNAADLCRVTVCRCGARQYAAWSGIAEQLGAM